MNLEEAIEIVEKSTNTSIPLGEFQHLDALRLLIEAGKRVQYQRTPGGVTTPVLLPGETKERTVQRQGKDIAGNYSYEERTK